MLAIQNGSKGCGVSYTPFFPTYTKDTECGNVYISGKYNESLTVIAENDVIINGSLTATGGSGGGEPTGSSTLGLIADKYVRLARIGIAVIEFGHIARPDQRAEMLEAARSFRDRDRQDRLPVLPELGALGHETQAIEVHVRAARHRDQRAAARAEALHPRLGAGHR